MELYTISLPDVTSLKLVTAKATYGIGFLTSFVGGFCALFGIPNNMYTEKIKKAEALAMQELEANVKSMGADGVMDVRCQIDGLTFMVSGTAYKWSFERKSKREAEEVKREADETYDSSNNSNIPQEDSNSKSHNELQTSTDEPKINLRKSTQCECGELYYGLYCPVCGKSSKTQKHTSSEFHIHYKTEPDDTAKKSHICKCGERFYGETCPNCGRNLKDLQA